MNWPDLTDVGFSTRVVEPTGTGSSHILIVGEAPGEVEDRTGVPFHPQAPAGGTLERLLRRAGYPRDVFRIWNVVNQRPPRNWLEGAPWQARAVEAWRPFLEREIERTKPRVILALGNVALRAVTNFGGQGAGVTQVARYVLRSNYDSWCIAAEHPSFILQGNQKLSGAVIFALHKAMEVARNGFARRTHRIISHPSLDEMLEFERGWHPDTQPLSYDIETPKSGRLDEENVDEEDDSYTIIRASLCYDDEKAISFPWSPPYTEVAMRMLARAKARRGWNSNGFDDPRLKGAGVTLGGRAYDVMDAWSHLQRTMPRGLGFVTPFYGWSWEPWKHLTDSEPEYYSACDALALHLNAEGIERDLRQQGRWENYERHVVECYEVLTKMSTNGLPYDAECALTFQKELEEKQRVRLEELQRLIPDSLKPSKQKQGLKREPKDTTGYVKRVFKVFDEEAKDIVEVERWCQLTPFLPTSWQQLLALLKHYGQKAPINRKTKKETTEDEQLKRMMLRCQGSKKERERELGAILVISRECRQLTKVLGTYVKGWRPGKDGRIHATPGFWGKMFRISWRRPNIAATIADKKEEYIASGFRKCVATSPGRVLCESDWKGIEAVLVGWFANDPDYMRLARLGVHDYMGINMAGRTVDLSLPDDELSRMFKDFKRAEPKLRDDAKHCCHGTNFGMGPGLMSELYEMPLRRAKELQAMYFSLFPKVKHWQESVVNRAHQEAKLVSPWGYVMWFWDVLRWNSRYQRMETSEDAKSAISFLPRDTAAGMLKEVILRLEQKHHLASEGIMLASTHDSITTECLVADVDEVARVVKEEMEAPVPVLNNLSIGVEQSVGESWDKNAMEPLSLGNSVSV